MKICVCCCTFNRPKQLGHLVRCFERQDYEDREMIILDDAGQYENQCGDRWRLVSARRRFGSLGEKRNACAALASPDASVLAIWDDDDLYLPWALSATAAALAQAEWSRPSVVLHPVADETGRWLLRQHYTGGLYHGGWAYSRAAFERVGGYRAGLSGPEDQDLLHRLKAAGTTESDPITLGWQPFYVYPWGAESGSYHISGMLRKGDNGRSAWRTLGRARIEPAVLEPSDPPQFDLSAPQILPSVQPRPF